MYDASGTDIGAVLSQKQEEVDLPLVLASTALYPVVQKYSEGGREALVCVWACEEWHLSLYGRQFRLLTDNQALVSVTGTSHRTLRLHDRTESLCRYSFRMKNRPGHCNQVTNSGGVGPGITAEQLEEALWNDEQLRQVLHFTQDGWSSQLPSEDFWACWQVREELKPFNSWSSCVMRGERVVVAVPLRGQVLELAHKGHLGIVL